MRPAGRTRNQSVKEELFMGLPEKVKALENGKGIQYLMDSAYRIFKSPVYVIDSFYNLIAFSGVPSDDPIWNELIRTGTFGMEAMEQMASENVVRDVSYSEKITRLESDKWNDSLISGRIFNGDDIWIGQTTMSEHIPFDAERTAAFEILLDKISAEIRSYDYFTKLPAEFFENAIKRLLDKTAENTLVTNPQAQIMHYGMEHYLYVAVVSAARNNILEKVHRSRLMYFQSLLKSRYKSYRYAIQDDHIIMLMSSEYGDYHEALPLGGGDSLFEHNGLCIGISDSFGNIYELRRYYEQALAALDNCLALDEKRRVFVHAP